MGKYSCNHSIEEPNDADKDYRCRNCWYTANKPEHDDIITRHEKPIENALQKRKDIAIPPQSQRSADFQAKLKREHELALKAKNDEFEKHWKEFDAKHPNGRDKGEGCWSFD